MRKSWAMGGRERGREARTRALVVSSYLGSGGGDRHLGSCDYGSAAGGRVHRERSMPRRPRGKRDVPDQHHFSVSPSHVQQRLADRLAGFSVRLARGGKAGPVSKRPFAKLYAPPQRARTAQNAPFASHGRRAGEAPPADAQRRLKDRIRIPASAPGKNILSSTLARGAQGGAQARALAL